MIVILDLGIGNLSSVRSALGRVGMDSIVVARSTEWDGLVSQGVGVQGVILPGVGAFGDAMFQLRTSGLLSVVRKVAREGRPLLGICLGMQLLFGQSEEHGHHIGLGFLPGNVVRFGGGYKVPHMGWNTLTTVQSHPLLRNVAIGDYVYFVHSYYTILEEPSDLLAATDYAGVQVPAVVARQNVFGAQFHPEKSGSVGEQILSNFASICNADVERRVNA